MSKTKFIVTLCICFFLPSLLAIDPFSIFVATTNLAKHYRDLKMVQDVAGTFAEYLDSVFRPAAPHLTGTVGHDTYDFIWDLNSVSEILTSAPWYIYWSPNMDREKFTTGCGARRHVTRIGVFGWFNRGKTFVLNTLADMQLPTGEVIHTRGISGVGVDCKFILLDSAGSKVPVNHTNELLRDRQATDAFLQDILFDNSDIALIVVNMLTLDDQIYLNNAYQRMSEQFPDGTVKNRVMVLHNYRNIETLKDIKTAIDTDIKGTLNATLMNSDDGIVYDSDKFFHFIMAKEGSEAGDYYNHKTKEVILKTAEGISMFCKTKNEFWDNFMESVTKLYRPYVQPTQIEKKESFFKTFVTVFNWYTQKVKKVASEDNGFNLQYNVLSMSPDELFKENPSSCVSSPNGCDSHGWTVDEVCATYEQKLVEPGQFILSDHIQILNGEVHIVLKNEFNPPKLVSWNDNGAYIMLEVGSMTENFICESFEKSVTISGHRKPSPKPPAHFPTKLDTIPEGSFTVQFDFPQSIRGELGECPPIKEGYINIEVEFARRRGRN